MVVDKGNEDWEEEEGLWTPSMPAPPPAPSGSSKPGAPSAPPPGRRGRSAGQPMRWSRNARGINLYFDPPA